MGVWTPGPGPTAGDDLFTGDATNEMANALAGSDTLHGDLGDDTLRGGDDDDSILGGEGNDRLFGGNRYQRDYHDFDAGSDTLDGGAGDDVIYDTNNQGASRQSGGDGNDWMFGSLEDSFDGGDGDDFIRLRHSHETASGHYVGGNGVDTLLIKGRLNLDGLAAADSIEIIRGDLFGDAGDNLFDLTGTDFRSWFGTILRGLIVGGAGDDTILGTDNDDQIIGDSSNKPFAGDDLLLGRGGSDTIDGNRGSDTLDGGNGADNLDAGADDAADILEGGNGADTLVAYGGDVIDGGDEVDLLVLRLNGLGASSPVTADVEIDITSGLVEAFAGGSVSQVEWIDVVSGSGNDRIAAGNLADTLDGGGGNDVLSGRAGGDTLVGGTGSDRLLGGQGGDDLTGDDGFDTLLGDDGDDTISADGFDVIKGGAGVDLLNLDARALETAMIVDFGAAAAGEVQTYGQGSVVDIETVSLLAGGGDDFITGGDGDDTLQGGQGHNTLSGGDGDDYITLLESYVPKGGDAGEAYGGVGSDAIIGNDGTDYLEGGEGDDGLSGGKGADTLYGGVGDDHMSGSAGADLYLFLDGDIASHDTTDYIFSFKFEEGDLVDLSDLDADELTAGDQAFDFIGEAAFSNQAGELRAEFIGQKAWLVEGDVDGDGDADVSIIFLRPPEGVTADWFVL